MDPSFLTEASGQGKKKSQKDDAGRNPVEQDMKSLGETTGLQERETGCVQFGEGEIGEAGFGRVVEIRCP